MKHKLLNIETAPAIRMAGLRLKSFGNHYLERFPDSPALKLAGIEMLAESKLLISLAEQAAKDFLREGK